MFLVLTVLFTITTHVACVQQTLVGVLENLEFSLTPKCELQMQQFLANFSTDQNSWALQMVDATSKIPSGLLNYNFGEMGDFHGCINIETGEILGKYCLGYLQPSPNSTLGTLSVNGQGPTWALCLPNACTTNDANVIGNSLLKSILDEIRVSFSDFLCQTKPDTTPELTKGAITTIVVLLLLVLITVASTCYDLYCIFSSKSCPLLVKGFSIYTNSQKVFKMTKPNPDQLPCLNGLKFISMMWVVAGHQFSVPMYGSLTNYKLLMQWSDKLYSMFIVSGTLSVDTFFTIGGALMSYSFLKAKYKKAQFNIPLYYLHRYLRLTTPFAIVVLVSATLIKYMGSGPKWPFMSLYFQKNCEDYWWSSLLYVQNYVNVSKMCVGQTWYLNIDMQLYIVSPFLFLALWKYPKFCLPFMGFCGLVSMGLSFYEAWENELPAILSNIYSPHSTDYQNKYYLLTHTRATPWIIGVILGYYLFKIKQNEIKFRLNRVVIVLMWFMSFGTLLACVLGGHSTLRSLQYDKIGNALHIALVRPSWSLATAWIILACTNSYGGPINWLLSLPIFQVLNRFTYGIYLTHVTFLYVIAYGRSWPDYFSGFNMAYQFWGTLWWSTGLAAFLVFTTESPMIVIEKLLFGNLGKKTPKVDIEKGTDNPAFQR